MTMNETVSLMLALVAGALLGAVFFGGLWWTVQKAVGAKRTSLVFLGSLAARTIIVLFGFYFIGGGEWESLLVCLLGFVAGRFIVTRLTRVSGKPTSSAP